MSVVELFSLSGKKAVITGGFTGLGKQIAEGLLESGADVAVCARRTDKWRDSYQELEKTASDHGRQLLGLRCDVSVQADVEGLVERALQEFDTIDVLVNAAGIAWASPPQDTKLEDWEKVLRVNLTGTFLCSQAVGKVMIVKGGGSIINLTSAFGLYGSDPEVLDAIGYNASKAGIVGFTRDLAVKWAKYNIRVNALAPGWFKTHLSEKVIEKGGEKLMGTIPMRRLGSDTDLKGAAVFLASASSSYMTGQVICIDGGLTAGR